MNGWKKQELNKPPNAIRRKILWRFFMPKTPYQKMYELGWKSRRLFLCGLRSVMGLGVFLCEG